MPFDQVTGQFVPTKSNIWRDAVDGYLDWVKQHVVDGAPIDESDFAGDPPLLLAAGNGHTSVVKYLLSEGADIEQLGPYADPPLMRAVFNSHYHTAELLLSEGADVNARDIGKNTALHWASQRGHVELVKLLATSGATIDAVNNNGERPIDLCKPTFSLSWRFAREVLIQFGAST